jgi:hypothetical protein
MIDHEEISFTEEVESTESSPGELRFDEPGRMMKVRTDGI